MRYAAEKFPIANYLTRWMDGGRALQLKHEINVESTIIERGTAKRYRDQHLVYIGWGKAPCIGFQTYASSNIPTIKAEKLDFEKVHSSP